MPIRTIKGKTLNVIDSLSYLDKLQGSQFYIDSVSQKAYTGKAIRYYGTWSYDSLYIANGYLCGWIKHYRKINNSFVISDLEFYNNQLNISTNVSKDRKKTSFARYITGVKYYFLEISYKLPRKIIVKQSIQENYNNTKNSKMRFKFSSINELEVFFRGHPIIYPYCKHAGFFDKEVHIPIIKGNCNCESKVSE